MKRRQLMTIVSLVAGLSVGLPAVAHPPSVETTTATVQVEAQGYIKSGNPRAAGGPLKGIGPMGYIKSGNPKAAGGPLNPGKGHPFEPY
jgi:hypothetical protein